MVQAAGMAARQRAPLRTLDAIELQGAIDPRLIARASGQTDPMFITADTRLQAATQALGSFTENPLAYS